MIRGGKAVGESKSLCRCRNLLLPLTTRHSQHILRKNAGACACRLVLSEQIRLLQCPHPPAEEALLSRLLLLLLLLLSERICEGLVGGRLAGSSAFVVSGLPT